MESSTVINTFNRGSITLEKLRVGDIVMDELSEPRKVISVTKFNSKLIEIQPKFFQSLFCSKYHLIATDAFVNKYENKENKDIILIDEIAEFDTDIEALEFAMRSVGSIENVKVRRNINNFVVMRLLGRNKKLADEPIDIVSEYYINKRDELVDYETYKKYYENEKLEKLNFIISTLSEIEINLFLNFFKNIFPKYVDDFYDIGNEIIYRTNENIIFPKDIFEYPWIIRFHFLVIILSFMNRYSKLDSSKTINGIELENNFRYSEFFLSELHTNKNLSYNIWKLALSLGFLSILSRKIPSQGNVYIVKIYIANVDLSYQINNLIKNQYIETTIKSSRKTGTCVSFEMEDEDEKGNLYLLKNGLIAVSNNF